MSEYNPVSIYYLNAPKLERMIKDIFQTPDYDIYYHLSQIGREIYRPVGHLWEAIPLHFDKLLSDGYFQEEDWEQFFTEGYGIHPQMLLCILATFGFIPFGWYVLDTNDYTSFPKCNTPEMERRKELYYNA